MFASCSKDETSDPSSESIELNITVADIGPDEPVTKASSIKEVWAEGDLIYIWYDSNTGVTPDLVITYDGSEWVGPEDIKAPAGESGYVKCVYDGRVKVAFKVNYTYTSSPSNRFKRQLSFRIDSWTLLTEVVVVVTDIPEGTDASLYTLACDKFTPLSGDGYTVGSDAITVTKGTKGATATGFASDVYDDAVAFAFATADYSSNAQDFEFTLGATTGMKAYTDNMTLEPSEKIKSITLAYSDFAAVSTDHEAVQLWEGGPVHVTWSSSDEAVATVDATTGKVTGVALGTATITATAGDGVSANCTVTVAYQTGGYVTVGGRVGVVYLYDSKPYVISVDEKKCNWSDAQKWCEDRGDSWYIPKVKELKAIYDVKATLNATLSSNGGTELSSNDYWASNEASTNWMWYVNLGSGIDNYTGKNANLRVRAVRAL